MGPAHLRQLRYLSPLRAFLVTWGVVGVVWFSVSNTTFERVTGSSRHSSGTAYAYVAAALAAFALGVLLGPSLFRGRRSARIPVAGLDERALETLRRAGDAAAAVGVAITLGMIGVGTLRAGGISPLFAALRGDEQSAAIFLSARLQGVSVWVHLTFACATIGSLGIVAARRSGADPAPFRRILLVGFLVDVVNGLVLDERLAIFEYIVAAFVATVGAQALTGRRLFTPRNVRRGLVLVGILVLVWGYGEYRRTYVPRYDRTATTEAVHKPSVARLGFDQFAAYVLSSPNNALYAVDHYRTQTYVFWSLNGVITTFLLDSPSTPIIGQGITRVSEMLKEIYYPNGPFTTFSLPGYAFLDLSWTGIGLLFWFGALCGAVFARFVAGELWAVLIYPFVFVGVVDSYRTMYWTQTRVFVPCFLIALTCRSLYKARHARRRLLVPAPRRQLVQ